ncbi:MAG: SRPBCC family protein [Prevotella sp.]|nr:SRPBCC family protein [Prevotella sp.]
MSLSTFESSVKLIEAPQQKVYDMLSDLNNLEKAKDQMPSDKLKDLRFDRDSVSVSVAPLGSLTLRVVEREEPKTIKFETANSPIPFNMWIQLLPASEESTKMKLTVKAELNPFIRGMVSGPIEQGLEKIAEALTMVQY